MERERETERERQQYLYIYRMKITNLPISNPFLATLQTTEAGVMIAGKVFDRSKGGTIFLELRPPPVCAASAAAAALKMNEKKYMENRTDNYLILVHRTYILKKLNK